MTLDPIANAIAAYAAGLEAEIAILRQLDGLSARQREASAANDIEGLNRIGDERDRLMASLVAVEDDIRLIRQRLAEDRDRASSQPSFARLVALHREAATLVGDILTSDEQTLQALRDAETARRFASRTLELGESTLSAYRRVVARPVTSASLFDTKG